MAPSCATITAVTTCCGYVSFGDKKDPLAAQRGTYKVHAHLCRAVLQAGVRREQYANTMREDCQTQRFAPCGGPTESPCTGAATASPKRPRASAGGARAPTGRPRYQTARHALARSPGTQPAPRSLGRPAWPP